MCQSTRLALPRVTLAVLLLSLACLVGCGGGKGPTLYPVTGKVLVNGKPAHNATVVFHPTAGGAEAVKPHATVGADGTFSLTSFATGDGAPAGEYRVTVEWWQSPVKKAGDPDAPPVNQLAAKYGKAESSGLVAQVQDGPTELKAFELKK
jgi:hypothetical protein